MQDRSTFGPWNSRHDLLRYSCTTDDRNERERLIRRLAINRPGSQNGSGILQADGTLVRTLRIARLEAALLISESAVPARKLAQSARLIDAREVQQIITLLNESYDRTRSAFRIEQTAAG